MITYSAYILEDANGVWCDVGFEADNLDSEDQAKEVLEILESALRKDRDQNHLTSTDFVSFIYECHFDEDGIQEVAVCVHKEKWSHTK